MLAQLILTVTCNDRPGVIEAISRAIEHAGGSWLESRLTHLGGKFAGVVRVHVEQNNAPRLTQALLELNENRQIMITVDPLEDTQEKADYVKARFSAIGPDRVGIVKEISKALVLEGINVEELETRISSMPYSGEPIFEASGVLSLPAHIDLRSLHEKMDAIANILGLDLDVETDTI